MGNFNKVILIGNLTRDPEMRYTPKGMAITKFSLAINRTWRDEAGTTKEEVTYVEVDAFGRQAEVLGQYVRKGSPLMVEGRLRLDTWEDKQTNQKRSKLGVVLENFQFLSSGGARPPEEGNAAPQRSPQNTAHHSPPPAAVASPSQPAGPAPSPVEELPPEEDDVPF